mgnify:CR=1 FL=1
MAEWIDRSREIFGKTNSQTQRRLRAVRTRFEVEAIRDGREVRYRITDWSSVQPADRAVRISPRLEAQVYALKGSVCAMCGRGPADGVKLQIDHKLPRSWGGKTEFDNLEPLCSEHNNGKRAFFATLEPHAAVIRKVIDLPTPWERIGEALKLFSTAGRQLPRELLPVLGRESHRGDPARRLRDLRVVLGWEIRANRRRREGSTVVTYELLSWKPWPPEGPGALVRRYERERRRGR